MCKAFVSLCCSEWGGGWGEGGRDVNTFRTHKQIWKSSVYPCIYDFGSLTWKWCTTLYCHWIEFPVLSGQVVGMVSKITGWKQESWWLYMNIHVASWPISSMKPRILNQWINLIEVWETHSFITLEFGNQKTPKTQKSQPYESNIAPRNKMCMYIQLVHLTVVACSVWMQFGVHIITKHLHSELSQWVVCYRKLISLLR